MIDRETVIQAYRLLLDRVPESDRVIDEKIVIPSVDVLIAELIGSGEFISRNRDYIRRAIGE